MLFTVVVVTFLAASCRKDYQQTVQTTPETMNELVVPRDFDWKTTKDYQLTVTSPTGGILEIMNAQNRTYQRTYLQSGQPHTTKLCLPAYENKIELKIGNQSAQIDLNSSALNYIFQ